MSYYDEEDNHLTGSSLYQDDIDEDLVTEQDKEIDVDIGAGDDLNADIKALVKLLLSKGVPLDDLYTDEDKDSPEIQKIKKKLRKKLAQHRSYVLKKEKDDPASMAEKEVKEEVRRFLDFNHNRQHDGVVSLGETDKNMSSYEQSLVKSEAKNIAKDIISATPVGLSFTEKYASNKNYSPEKTPNAPGHDPSRGM